MVILNIYQLKINIMSSDLSALFNLSKQPNIKELIKDAHRNRKLIRNHKLCLVDGTRNQMTIDDINEMERYYKNMEVDNKISAMFSGDKINITENRGVGHMALRGTYMKIDNEPVCSTITKVKINMFEFADGVREGKILGYTNKKLKNILCIGIGGSYLGLDFVYNALKSSPECEQATFGRNLRIIANVDPVDFHSCVKGLNPEETLAIIISKTFTTAETMLNAKTVRDWFLKHYKNNENTIKYHFCAVSTAVDKCVRYGILESRIFAFWDWVGGRYSVTSAVGILPLALHFGSEICRSFLAGAQEADTDVIKNKKNSISALLAMISFWHTVYCKYNATAIIPYSQALSRFPAHIQQLSMESNGKAVQINGELISNANMTGEIIFGEPGTNAQHSFFQLIHQGRIIPCEFIGFCKSQANVKVDSHPISNHDELMCNFFAQADALAEGRSVESLKENNEKPELYLHKAFTGNRPSLSILFKNTLNAYTTGFLLGIYEHKVAIQGFLFNINSFDQWGVELGKVLANKVRETIKEYRNSNVKNKSLESLDACDNIFEYYLQYS